MEDSFIGSKFGKEDQLEVLEWDGVALGNKKKYNLFCSICALDPELFGKGVFKATKAALERGGIPCGCSPMFKPTKEQYRIKVLRECSRQNCAFVEFSEDTIGAYSYVKTICNVCNKANDKTIVNRFLAGVGCKCKTSKPEPKADEDYCEKFLATGKFTDGTTFRRLSKYSRDWEVSCPRCMKDEFTKEGLCIGKFVRSVTQLLQGSCPCRCAKNFYFTKTQRDFQAREIVKRFSEVEYVGMIGEYNHLLTDVTLKCKIHGNYEKPLAVIVGQENFGCPSCSKTGFKPHLSASLYLIKMLKDGLDYCGYGITNNIQDRFYTHDRTLAKGGYGCNRIMVYDMPGRTAEKIEKLIKKKFPLVPLPLEGFKTETTYGFLYKYVKYFIEEKLEEEGIVQEDE